MKHIHYLLLSVLLAFSSCQNNEETIIENNFKGHYKITAMESDQPLDLNNDGISSSNLYEEIAAPVHGNNKDETPIPFYHLKNGATTPKSARLSMTNLIINCCY